MGKEWANLESSKISATIGWPVRQAASKGERREDAGGVTHEMRCTSLRLLVGWYHSGLWREKKISTDPRAHLPNGARSNDHMIEARNAGLSLQN